MSKTLSSVTVYYCEKCGRKKLVPFATHMNDDVLCRGKITGVMMVPKSALNEAKAAALGALKAAREEQPERVHISEPVEPEQP